MKSIVTYINESYEKNKKIFDKVESVSDYYAAIKKLGWDKKYPYASECVAHFIYGDRSNDNLIVRIIKNLDYSGHQYTLEDETALNDIALSYEYSWIEYMQDFDNEIKALPLKNGETVGENY